MDIGATGASSGRASRRWPGWSSASACYWKGRCGGRAHLDPAWWWQGRAPAGLKSIRMPRAPAAALSGQRTAGSLGDLQRRPAVRALHLVADLHEGLANGTQDVGLVYERGPLGRSLGLHLRRNHAQVERRRAAVQTDIPGLRDPVVLVDAVSVQVDLRKQRAV